MNAWPKGYRHAIDQIQHQQWNASHYPGTRQLCCICGEPTGRCEEDSMYVDEKGPLCDACYTDEFYSDALNQEGYLDEKIK